MRTIELKDDDDLFIHGKATDHIWCMEDKEGYIGVRLDCGDSGTVYLTHEQAEDLIEQLADMLAGPKGNHTATFTQADPPNPLPIKITASKGAPPQNSPASWKEPQ